MFICSSVTAFSLLALSSFLLNSLLRLVSISTLSSVHGALSNFFQCSSLLYKAAHRVQA